MATRFVAENLSPGERLGELLFGLIMTLSFTLGAGAFFGGEEGASRDLLWATLGCNLAWGIIDAALYLLGVFFDRGRLSRLGRAVRSSADATSAIALVASELDETLDSITSAEKRDELYRHVVERVRSAQPRAVRLTLTDMKAAVVVFWSVVITTAPAALPFAFIDDPWLALRASNVLLLVFLFVIGFLWARYTSFNPWLSGFALTALGLLMVLIAIPLGG